LAFGGGIGSEKRDVAGSVVRWECLMGAPAFGGPVRQRSWPRGGGGWRNRAEKRGRLVAVWFFWCKKHSQNGTDYTSPGRFC